MKTADGKEFELRTVKRELELPPIEPPATKREPPSRKYRGKFAGLMMVIMAERGVTGDPRDHVVISGSDIFTHKQCYAVTSIATGEEVDVRNHAEDGKKGEFRTIHHRSTLHEVFNYEFERVFWRRGRRTLK